MICLEIISSRLSLVKSEKKFIFLVATGIRESNFINVNKLISTQNWLPGKKEIDDVEFFVLMSSHPSAIVPVCKFFLALTHNKLTAFCRGDDAEFLIIKNIKAYKTMLQAAKAGHHYAQYTHGYNYDVGGDIIKTNYGKAAHWYNKSQQEANPDATFRIGRLLYYGLGFEKNYKEALKCLECVHPVAEQYAEARLLIGQIYEAGSYGVVQDIKKAIQSYTQSINSGSTLAANNLGSIYLWGRPGISVDYKKASQWFVNAKSDCAASQFSLGFMYFHGFHYKVDFNKALEYFISAHQGGYSFAQFGIDLVDKIQMMSAMQVKVSRKDYEEYAKLIMDNAPIHRDEKTEVEHEEEK
jgi:hypothetical protein